MLKKINYSTLIIFSIFLGLAPFVPEPHLLEKIKMLMHGTLTRPIDIFDLVFHASPLFVLGLKFYQDRRDKKKA